MSEVESLINIGGVVRRTSELTLPEDARFRDAWVLNGDIVSFDAEKKRKILHAQIDEERARRIERGATFSVPGIAEPVGLPGRAKDQSVYLALLIRAQGAKAAGVTAPVLTLRDGADNILALTPDQMIALIGQAMTWFESVMAVSWAIKDGTGAFADGLPNDWRGDQYWP